MAHLPYNSIESFAFCHSEGAKRPKNLLFTPFRALADQGKLGEGSKEHLEILRYAQNDRGEQK